MDPEYQMLSILIIVLSLVVVNVGKAYFAYKLRVELNRQHHEIILLLCKTIERANDKEMLATQENMYRYLKDN